MTIHQHSKTILITGAAGYIASHTIIELLADGYTIIAVDNYSNAHPKVFDRIAEITGHQIDCHIVDICDLNALSNIFIRFKIDAVIHFAAFKSVNESIQQPLKYYQNNLIGLLNVLECMQKYAVKHFVFSSSATVYGHAKEMPITENAPRSAINPYGQTKLMAELILEDIQKANPEFYIACLRYFNPVGAHPSGLIGENPQGVPNNLLPYITEVAVAKRTHLDIFGNDYPTHDGTGVRDFIHVCDLARGHVAACDYLFNHQASITVNLGTGEGYSVLDLFTTFQTVNHLKLSHQFKPRRSGDVAVCYADVSKAHETLGWQAQKSIEDICRDAWNWQAKNPNGY
jgi:UDP-glucose 4-epimerase